MKIKTKFLLSAVLVSAAVLLPLAADWQVRRSAAPYVADEAAALPEMPAALVLGTAPQLADGSRNPYFDYRIGAAAKLYRQGRVRRIIVSGDNRRHGYNEPDAMAAALAAQGVPPERIHADYAGLRTLDSVIRARDIFGQTRYIVVSQRFHNERAVYLARSRGIEAYGYNARDVGFSFGLKTRLREYLARVKMFVDLWSGRQPRHGGPPAVLPE